MATNEGLQPVSNDQVPVDPNVRIPDHVRAASQAAEAIHKQAYTPPVDPAVEEAARAEAARVAAEAAAVAAAAPPVDQQPQPQDQHPAPRPEDQNVTAEEWRHRFLSMQGRFNQSQKTLGAMEQQMVELGQELVRTQNMMAQVQPSPAPQPQSQPAHNNLITDEDRANYGDELIDLARRAALSTVTPELEKLRADNAQLTQRVQTTGKRELFAELDRQLPTWRQINGDRNFKLWLRLPNVYTGQIRQNMLNAAVNGAQAPKVLALFKDFLSEASAAGQLAPAAQVEQLPAPHVPALDLETLAAPGRARPASGDSQVPAAKPIYSRAQISKFYDDSRKGLYAGRQAEYDQMQNDLTVAQREGRIR